MNQVSAFIWTSIPEYFSASATAGWYSAADPHNQALPCGMDCVRSVPTVQFGLDDLGCNQMLPFICES